ncbi:MAG: hypothetical protein AB7D07_05390 [Desulfovibrionaceae bacterium]
MNRLMIALLTMNFLLAPAFAEAEKQCFRIINRTKSPLQLENKDGNRTYPEAPPYSLTNACCDPLYERLCFDKSDKSIKMKINALVGKPAQAFSGDTCRKLYIHSGSAILVARDTDGIHIKCKVVPPGEKIDVAADFDELDANHDGQLDPSEAAGMDMEAMRYSQADHNGDKIIDRREYDGYLQKVNIFRGVPF